ncbi:MAG: phosphopantetheine-binding protein [Steroidobacteraceae bacterium]
MLMSGLFFAPKRRVRIELVEPEDLPRQGERLELTEYLDRFYNHVAPPRCMCLTVFGNAATHVNYRNRRIQRRESSVMRPRQTRNIVTARLQTMTGLKELKDDQELARDLGLDSLAIVEALLWLESEFGISVPNPEAGLTVGDLIMAACGGASSESTQVRRRRPSRGWRANAGNARVQIPTGSSIQEVFLAQARPRPGQVIAADLIQGSRTYRQLITAILALRPKIAALPGQFVGIMLPASVAPDAVLMATLSAGKTPVMINWTAGLRVVQLGLDRIGVPKILTAQALLRRLSAQGMGLTGFEDRVVSLETLAGTISWTSCEASADPDWCRRVRISYTLPRAPRAPRPRECHCRWQLHRRLACGRTGTTPLTSHPLNRSHRRVWD